MQAERTNWNDERLDEFADEFRAFRREASDRFVRLEDKIDARFDRLNHTLIYITASLLIAIVASHFAAR